MAKKINLVNLTPHAINFVVDDKELEIPASGTVARCAVSTEIVGMAQVGDIEIPITKSVFGEVQGLPEPQEGTYYIVSLVVAKAAAERNDIFIPNEQVRDEKGRIVGCRSLGIA